MNNEKFQKIKKLFNQNSKLEEQIKANDKEVAVLRKTFTQEEHKTFVELYCREAEPKKIKAKNNIPINLA